MPRPRLQLCVFLGTFGFVALELTLKNTDFCSPGALPPVRVTLLHAGGVRTGVATTCETHAGSGSAWLTDCGT